MQHDFQIHLQVGAREFASLYNLAQAVTAPVLAAAVNSPLLLGQRLWHETRIALFETSVDTRPNTLEDRRFGRDPLRRRLGAGRRARSLPRGHPRGSA